MNTTFCQSLRHKLMEIFHPRDFRKFTSCKCQQNKEFCTENDCTENDKSSSSKVSFLIKQDQELCSENTLESRSNSPVGDEKRYISTVQSNCDFPDRSQILDCPHSFQTLTESISRLTSQSKETHSDPTEELEQKSSASELNQSNKDIPTSDFNDTCCPTAIQSSAETEDISTCTAKECKDSVSDFSPNEASETEYNPRDKERDLMLKRILIKVLIICLFALLTMLLAPKSKANDHHSMASISTGVLYPNGLDMTVQYEHSTTYHNAWAVELNGYLRWRKCPDCHKVCRKSFWDNYRSYHVGILYKPCVTRSRNQHGCLRLGASVGYDQKNIIAGALLGYEQTYCLPHGLELFWTAKTDVMVLARNWVRPGLSIGLRFPL